MTSEFLERLQREKLLALRELQDGCVDCLAGGTGFCKKHMLDVSLIDCMPEAYFCIGRVKKGPLGGKPVSVRGWDGKQPKKKRKRSPDAQ